MLFCRPSLCNNVFHNLQKELERARQEQEYATTEKQDLERRLQQQHSGDSDLKTSYSDLEVSQLKAEIEVSFYFLMFLLILILFIAGFMFILFSNCIFYSN